MKELNLKINRVLRLLECLQKSDGSFAARVIGSDRETLSIFPTLCCANCLLAVNDEVARNILRKTRRLILANQSENLTWNYWRASTAKPCPNDLDDASNTMTVLLSSNLADTKTVKAYGEALYLTDGGYGGPFNTWILNRRERGRDWHDIDIVVNANILRSLNMLGVEANGLTSFIKSCVERERYHSKYYENIITIIYHITRAYQGKSISSLVRKSEKHCEELIAGESRDPLLLAHALSTLIRLNGRSDLMKSILACLLSVEFAWDKPFPFYTETISGGISNRVGSPAITLSAVAEALFLYNRHWSKEKSFHSATNSCKNEELEKIADSHILSSACASPEIINRKISVAIQCILRGKNIRRVLELPMRAGKELVGVEPIDGEVLDACVAIGIAGWAAWTCSDAIRDSEPLNELGNESNGGKDNASNRNDRLAVFSILQSITHELINRLQLPLNKLRHIYRLIASMEEANCGNGKSERPCEKRIENRVYGLRRTSAEKSMGAAIPLLALMMKSSANKKDIRNCQKFFFHFILARQLSDDACDWREDLAGGRETLMTRWILNEIPEDSSAWNESDENAKNVFNDDIPKELAKIFDEKVSLWTAREIIKQSCRAVYYARKITCFKDVEFLESLPQFYEKNAMEVIEKHDLKKIFESEFWRSKA